MSELGLLLNSKPPPNSRPWRTVSMAERGTYKAAHAAVQTMIKPIPMCVRWFFVLVVVLSSALEVNAAAGNDEAMIGQQYEIVGELYALSVADDLNSRVVSIIDLVPLQLRGPEIISRQVAPTGSILTIVGKEQKRFFTFLYPERYIVRVNTLEAPTGVPIVIDLARGIEGKSTVLNPLIFKPLF